MPDKTQSSDVKDKLIVVVKSCHIMATAIIVMMQVGIVPSKVQ